MLNLKKPIAFLDVETTGLNIGTDRVIEVCFHKVSIDKSTTTKTWLINPEQPIPKAITKLTSISDEHVKDAPIFKMVAKDMIQFIQGCDLGGFNLMKLDIPILMEEFLRAEVEFDISKRKIVDSMKIFHKMEQRNLSAAYQFYCDKTLENAHGAEVDTIATYEVFEAQLERYPNLGTEVETVISFLGDENDRFVDLAGRIVWENKKEVFNFGKYKSRPVEEILQNDPSYYNWMMNGDFPLYTKKKLTEIRLRLKNK